MAKFHKYLHVYRLGVDDVAGILAGTCYVTPKMDGTNSSVWFDLDKNEVCAGSRTRELNMEKDNAEFYYWAVKTNADEAVAIRNFVTENPRYTVCGEWLGLNKFVGNIKDYDDAARGHLWVFDMYDNDEEHYVKYDIVLEFAKEYGFDNYVLPCLGVFENPTEDELLEVAKNNKFMLDNANHAGEGIVIKNYDYRNAYGHFEVAKIVLDEYKQNKAQSKKVEIKPGEMEQAVVDLYCTDAEMAKNKAKVALACGLEEFDNRNNKCIGMFLNFCFYDSVLSEAPNWVKKLKNPTIDFRALQALVFTKARNYIGL